MRYTRTRKFSSHRQRFWAEIRMHFTGIDKEVGCDIRPPGERVEDVPGRTVPESCGAMPRKGIDLPSDGYWSSRVVQGKTKTSRNLRAVGNERINRVAKSPETNRNPLNSPRTGLTIESLSIPDLACTRCRLVFDAIFHVEGFNVSSRNSCAVTAVEISKVVPSLSGDSSAGSGLRKAERWKRTRHVAHPNSQDRSKESN